MPAAILDDFVAAVAEFLGAGKIAEPQHPRAKTHRRIKRLAIHEVAIKILFKFPDERMVLPQLPPQAAPVENIFKHLRIQERMTGAWEKVFVEGNFAAHFLDRAGAGDFVQIRHEHEIIRAAVGQTTRNRIALEIFGNPRIGRLRHVIHDDVDNFVMECAEPRAIGLLMQWFWLVRVRLCRLDDDKFIHDTGEFVQPQFEQFQLVEKSEAVVNHRDARLFYFFEIERRESPQPVTFFGQGPGQFAKLDQQLLGSA